jgi:hypothetical protein
MYFQFVFTEKLITSFNQVWLKGQTLMKLSDFKDPTKQLNL